MTSFGGVQSDGNNVNSTIHAVRPAFNLNLNSVLFTSDPNNGGHNSSFTAPTDYTGSEWKLTLKDSNDFSTGASVAGSTVLKIGYEATTLTVNHTALSNFADAGYTDVTAMLTDESGNILYYGSINNDTSATSSTVTIPAGLTTGAYTLSVYGEDWNGEKMTDYATGTPFTTNITVENWKVTWSNGDGGSYEQDVAIDTTITVPKSELFNETMRKGGYEITGWTSSDPSYTVGAAMPAKDLTFTAQYTPAALIGTVTVSGTAKVGETLTATVTETNNTGELSYQWYRDIVTTAIRIPDATSSTYVITINERLCSLYCEVTSSVQTGRIASNKTEDVPPLNFAEGDITVEGYSDTYDGLYHGITVTAPEGATVTYSSTSDGTGQTEPLTYKDAGTYTVYYTVKKTGYESVSGSAVIQIDKVYLDVTANTLYAEVGDVCPTPTYTITGFVDGETADNVAITGTPTLSYSETPDMSKTGTYFIDVDTTDMSAANYEFNGVYGIFTVLEHVHNFTGYTVEGDTIYGTCSESDCPKDGTVKLLTIAAPADAVYEQGLYHNASLNGYDPQVELDSESIVYTKDGAKTDPVDAGIYTASYTYEGVTAGVTYEVAKRPLTITADDETIYVGNSAPEYTYTVSGWSSNHDAEDEFSHKVSGVTAVCENANLNRAGTYTITISGTPVVLEYYGNDVSANYELTTQNDTLTVSKRSSSGGGGYVASYTITTEDAINGTVKADKTHASSGTTVTLTVTPDTGYTLETLTVTTSSGKEIELTSKGDGKYTFKMPSSKVTVKATFMDDNTMLNFFVDVSADAYYHDAVLWAAVSGITNGTSATTFSPDNPCTRAQMATFLWRAAGSPEPADSTHPFADVPADAYYTKAVQWAAEQGITAGTSTTTFSPDAACTRAQMATFIYRYEQAGGGGFTGLWMFRLPFTDAPEWAFEPIAWCYKEGITVGTSATTFSPDDPCTRAQMMTFLYRYFEN